jgi:hypothetical protein
MTNQQFKAVRDLLGYDNLRLGQELGYKCTQYQCKQVDNLVSGYSIVKPIVVLALECLARRNSQLKEFKKIVHAK